MAGSQIGDYEGELLIQGRKERDCHSNKEFLTIQVVEGRRLRGERSHLKEMELGMGN